MYVWEYVVLLTNKMLKMLNKHSMEECIFDYEALNIECRLDKNSLLRNYVLLFLPGFGSYIKIEDHLSELLLNNEITKKSILKNQKVHTSANNNFN